MNTTNGETKIPRFSDQDFSDLAQIAVLNLKSGADIEELNRLKKLYKKAVPLTMRSYVGAYVTKLWLEKNGKELPRLPARAPAPSPARPQPHTPTHTARHDGGSGRRGEQGPERGRLGRDDRPEGGRFGRNRPGFRGDSPGGHVLKGDSSATVYIGVGRTLHATKGGIISLLVKLGGLERRRIGEIRVLDSYTFVQLYTADADTAIARLDGRDFHGQKLSVGYSQKTGDGGDIFHEEGRAAEGPSRTQEEER
jgi:hypothetical protein